MRGLLWGVVIAVVLAIVGFFFGNNPVTANPNMGFFDVVWTAIVLSLAFILGVWLGDMLEGRRARTGGVRRV
jgi:amino acid permease